MACFKTAAAICLVALSGLRSEATVTITHKLTVEEVTEDAYLVVNLARNGKLPVHINPVETSDSLVSSVQGKINEAGKQPAEGGCESVQISADLKNMFFHAFENAPETTPDYSQVLQDALTAGLSAFTEKRYPKTSEEWKTIWAKEAGASLGHLLGSNSTQIGCAVGRCTEKKTIDEPESVEETKKNKAVLFCELSPATTKETAPFEEEYFNGLIARTAQLSEMTADDLKAPSNNGTGAALFPTILIYGLVLMLTAVSA
ncbi:SAG family member [Eimeria brunetti]|uniref:SAG family member n=1 Tax=Eimeria brunetti TaxID=51314 RepID=U6LXR3_9EIME|nr:SAG family member [Eimeria brunetti]